MESLVLKLTKQESPVNYYNSFIIYDAAHHKGDFAGVSLNSLIYNRDVSSGFHEIQIPALIFTVSPFWRL